MPKPRINIAAINAVLRNRRSSDDAKSRKAALSGQDGASGGLPSVRTEDRASGASEINVFDGIDEAELLAADSWLPYQANVRCASTAQLLQQAQEAAAAKVEAGAQDGGAPLPDGIELTTTPAAPPLTSAEAMEARLARLEEQQLRILSLLEAKLQ